MADLYQPAVPPQARTAVYWAGLIVGFLSLLAIGVGAVLVPEHVAVIAGVAGATGTAFGFLASALGVVYRPTAGAIAPAEISVVTTGIDAESIAAEVRSPIAAEARRHLSFGPRPDGTFGVVNEPATPDPLTGRPAQED